MTYGHLSRRAFPAQRPNCNAPGGTIQDEEDALSPSASRRSVLTGIAFSAPFTWWVFMSTVLRPASVSPWCSHCDEGPASRPITSLLPSRSSSRRAKAASSISVSASWMILPYSLITQINAQNFDIHQNAPLLHLCPQQWLRFGEKAVHPISSNRANNFSLSS